MRTCSILIFRGVDKDSSMMKTSQVKMIPKWYSRWIPLTTKIRFTAWRSTWERCKTREKSRVGFEDTCFHPKMVKLDHLSRTIFGLQTYNKSFKPPVSRSEYFTSIHVRLFYMRAKFPTDSTLPETNSSPLKMDGCNSIIFRCYVSFRKDQYSIRTFKAFQEQDFLSRSCRPFDHNMVGSPLELDDENHSRGEFHIYL